MARTAKKFAEGGSADRSKARYDRKVADIESDYGKWQKSGKYGNAGTAKAKYEQRMADAKDDLAKWTGGDRTATSAAEKASESALSEARRTKGQSMTNRDSVESALSKMGGNEPLTTAKASTSDLLKATQPQSFGAAFRQARQAPRGATKAPPAPIRNIAKILPRPTPAPAAAKPTTPDKAPKFNLESLVGKRDVKPLAPSQADYSNKRVADLTASAAQKKKLESAPVGAPGAALARLKNMVGFGSSADTGEAQATRQRAANLAATEKANVASTAQQEQARQAIIQRNKAKVAAGNAPGASGLARSTAAFYAKNPDAMRKGGSVTKKPTAKKAAPVKKYAKGGSIDGCAIRGKTRCKGMK